MNNNFTYTINCFRCYKLLGFAKEYLSDVVIFCEECQVLMQSFQESKTLTEVVQLMRINKHLEVSTSNFQLKISDIVPEDLPLLSINKEPKGYQKHNKDNWRNKK